MFSHLKNIDTAFRHIRAFSLLMICLNTGCMCFCIYKSHQLVEKAQGRVQILYNGKILETFASDRKSNLEVELRDHIRTFHQHFFNLDPDERAIQRGIGKALYLADESAKKTYDNLKESGYYQNMISANISQQIEVDSIALILDPYPYRFTCYATQTFVRSSSTVLRKLVTSGEVRELNSETDHNPHGFLIQKWQTLENTDTSKPLLR